MPTTSNHGFILESIETAIKALVTGGVLPGINVNDVVVLPAPTDDEAKLPTLPCIIICPFGTETVVEEEGTNASDTIGYPSLVALLAAGNEDPTFSVLDTRLKWREELLDELIHNRSIFASVPRIFNSMVEPADIVDLAAWFDMQLFVSGLIVVVEVLKRRRA